MLEGCVQEWNNPWSFDYDAATYLPVDLSYAYRT